jgi:hypothetical protein
MAPMIHQWESLKHILVQERQNHDIGMERRGLCKEEWHALTSPCCCPTTLTSKLPDISAMLKRWIEFYTQEEATDSLQRLNKLDWYLYT